MSRGLGDVYKRQLLNNGSIWNYIVGRSLWEYVYFVIRILCVYVCTDLFTGIWRYLPNIIQGKYNRKKSGYGLYLKRKA